MTGFIDRLGELTKIELEDLPYIEANASDPEKDKGGSASDLLALSYRFLAVSDYILKGDIISFRSNLIKASSIQNNLFDRFEKGEAIAPSLVTMLSYQALFNALASADWHLSEVLALKMGGREDIEKKVDHPFDYAMGYCLKSFVLGDQTEMKRWHSELAKQCEKKDNMNFRGYPLVFQGILNRNSSEVNVGFEELLRGHKKLCKGRGVFKNTVDEILCIWGLGMANLVRKKGLNVAISDELIPNELIV